MSIWIAAIHFINPAERVPNGRCSPRRGETAKQVARGRGGTRVLGTVGSQRQSFIDHLSPIDGILFSIELIPKMIVDVKHFQNSIVCIRFEIC